MDAFSHAQAMARRRMLAETDATPFIPECCRLMQPAKPKTLSDEEWFWLQDRAERELMTYPEEP